MDIKYKIEIHTTWHCGSGLSRGADVDALAVKDNDGLPFIPGKTIKGLLREAVEDYLTLSGNIDKEQLFVQTFGTVDERSVTFFGNAVLAEGERKAILSDDITQYMYQTIASTALDSEGIAKEHSLRKMEVVIPCTLYGTISGVPEEMQTPIEKAMGLVKCIGVNRNRGLGRCTMSIIK